MRKGLIFFIIVVLAAGSLAGIVYYRKNIQKDSQLAEQYKEIETLKKKISMLDQDAANLKKESTAKQERIESLEDEKQQMVQLEKLLKEKDNALAAVNKASGVLKDSVSGLEAKLENEQAAFRLQNEKLQTAHSKIEQLTSDLGKATQSRIELEKHTKELEAQLMKGREETQNLALELQKEQEENRTLKTELTQAHDDITSDQIEFQNKQKELEAAQALIANLQQEIKQHKTVKAILEEQVSDFKTQIRSLKEAYQRIQTLQKEIQNTADINLSLKNQISTLQIRLNDFQEEKTKYENRIEEKEKLLKQIATNLNRCLANSKDVEASLKSAQSQMIGLKGLVEQAEAEQTVMSGRLSILETEKGKLEEKVTGLVDEMRGLEKDRYEGQLAFQNKQKELEDAQSEIAMLKEEAQKNLAVKAILEKEVSGFKTQLLDLKDTHQKVQTLQKEIKKTADFNSLLKNQIAVLQLQMDNYQKKNRNYTSTIEEKESQLKQIVTNLNTCLVNSKDVETSLQKAQSQVVKLVGIVEEARAEQVVMSKQLSNLESEKAEMAIKLTEVKKTYETLIRELHDKIETKKAVVEDCDKKFTVTFVDRVLFYSGKASITTAGQQVLKKTGDILSKMSHGIIRIAGHTDNIPIRRGWRGRFPTNWELASARASAVARFFQKESGISPEKMEVVGFGAHRPVASNMTRAGRARNRRVEIIIAPMGPMISATH